MQDNSSSLEGYARVLSNYLENPIGIASLRKDHHKKGDDYFYGAPDDRLRLELDDEIEDLISSLPPATRIYPEVYAWKITEIVKSYYKHYERSEND